MIGPLRRPLWLAATVGEGLLEVALDAVRALRGALEEVVLAEPAPPVRSAPTRTRPTAEPPPVSAPDVPAPTPSPSPLFVEAKVLDDEPELVGEFGEEGAEDDAGADVSVDEPWEGYGAMNVGAVRDRLAAADRELLAAVLLYEGFTKKRSSVIDAAERRLTRLSPPRS